MIPSIYADNRHGFECLPEIDEDVSYSTYFGLYPFGPHVPTETKIEMLSLLRDTLTFYHGGLPFGNWRRTEAKKVEYAIRALLCQPEMLYRRRRLLLRAGSLTGGKLRRIFSPWIQRKNARVGRGGKR